MADRRERGFVTVQYVAASAFAMVLLVLAANVLVDLYARAAVRDALDEGVRAAVPVGRSAADCDDRAHEALRTLLHGRIGQHVNVKCHLSGGRVLADAQVRLVSFLPGVIPSWSFALHAEARAETP